MITAVSRLDASLQHGVRSSIRLLVVRSGNCKALNAIASL